MYNNQGYAQQPYAQQQQQQQGYAQQPYGSQSVQYGTVTGQGAPYQQGGSGLPVAAPLNVKCENEPYADNAPHETGSQPPPPPPKYKDIPFAVLFVVHFFVILIVAFTKGVKNMNAKSDYSADFEVSSTTPSSDNQSMAKGGSTALGGIVVVLFVAIGLAYGALHLSIKLGATLISFVARAMIAMFCLCAVVNFASGNAFGGVIFLLLAAFQACWYRAVQSRIPFAGANLSLASRAVSRFPALFAVTGGALLLSFLWMLVWCVALIGVAAPKSNADNVIETPAGTFQPGLCTDVAFDDDICKAASNCCSCASSDGATTMLLQGGACDAYYGGSGSALNGGLYFLMLISLYWGGSVISNVVHCVVAGTVSAWWFQGNDVGRTPVFDSFSRAVSYSFGSICFGSLIVAVLKAIKQVLKEAQRNKNAQLLMCCIMCILNMIESMLEFFNRYAYCYVAIYGYDFRKAGKSVFDLFHRLGWTAIINDSLIDDTLNWMALGCGAITATIGYLYGLSASLTGGWLVVLSLTGFLFGWAMCDVTMSVVSSAVATIFVCWAEAPAAFMQVHPDEAKMLNDAWMSFHGPVYAACGHAKYANAQSV